VGLGVGSAALPVAFWSEFTRIPARAMEAGQPLSPVEGLSYAAVVAIAAWWVHDLRSPTYAVLHRHRATAWTAALG
jgi:hypothetical protein